jgi:hypothetical protein
LPLILHAVVRLANFIRREHSTNSSNKDQSGDPGRTPGKVEGSREIIEKDLKQKNKQEKE